MSPSEHEQVRKALDAARADGASLAQLMAAHQIAEKWKLVHVVAELRQHVRHMIPDKRLHISTTNNILLGIVSGVFTHYLLKAMEKRGFIT
jgi:hypothetical protein